MGIAFQKDHSTLNNQSISFKKKKINKNEYF